MSNAIQLGPLLLPLALLLVFASAGTSLVIGRQVGKRAGVDAESAVWAALLVGVVVARLAFVYEYRALYLTTPLSILDIRDGGWNAPAGLVGMWLYGLHRYRKTPALRKPLRWAMVTGTTMFAIGTLLLALQPGGGKKLPDLSFTSLDGQPVELRGFIGKPTVINLWATWCPPCVREMPLLHEAQQKHSADMNFVFLNQGEEHSQVAQWLQGRQLPLRNVLLDPRRQASA
ncbi:MAG: TlpA disulfide reductase family protein, partial [Burkholderiaceae bacterium]